MSSFKRLVSCFSKDGGPREDVEKRFHERLTTFGAIMMMFKARSVYQGVERVFFEILVISTMTYCVKRALTEYVWSDKDGWKQEL